MERGVEALVVEEAGLVEALARANPESFQKMRGDWMASAWNWVWLGAGLVALVALVAWFEVIPLIASAMAGAVPESWEDNLGRGVSEQFLRQAGECKDERVTAALREMVTRLDRAKPTAYQFRVRVSRSGDVNAFAAPGGHVVVMRGLLEKADTPEEVAGVLAHEMEHVRQRHVTRGLMRSATVSALASMVFGDIGTLGSAVEYMGKLQFQREDEASADREGFANLVAARIDPRGMTDFFGKLSQMEGKGPALATYLSTHPDTKARQEEIERMLARVTVHPSPLRSRADWTAIRTACAAER
jgi:predicted Zn-dependent protease